MMCDLKRELATLALGTGAFAVRHLHRLGVSWETIAAMGEHHYSFGVGRISPIGNGLFEPSEDGRPQLILPVFEGGALVDLVAFATSDPFGWRLRTGNGWALGLEWGLDELVDQENVTLHASPLDWLRGDCQGLCLVDWTSPQVAQLLQISNINCADERLASLIGEAVARHNRLPTINIVGRK